MIRLTDKLLLDPSEIEEKFVRASRPGGQNVNKVATAVQLRFDIRHSPSLPEDVRGRLERIAGRRATQDGILVILARRHRTQERNRQDVLERLVALIRLAAEPDRERRRTKVPRAERNRRLDEKARHATIKRQRGAPVLD